MASTAPKGLFIIYITCFLFLFPVVFSGELEYADGFNTADSAVKIEKRQLVGSSPPNCNGKCGGCAPCKTVLVDVPPAEVVSPQWFYMVWRCSCGGQLFMPNGTPVHG